MTDKLILISRLDKEPVMLLSYIRIAHKIFADLSNWIKKPKNICFCQFGEVVDTVQVTEEHQNI